MNAAEQALAAALTKKGLEVLRNGWPDFLVINPSKLRPSAFALELKVGKDRVSPAQARVHGVLRSVGLPVYVARGEDGLQPWSGRAFLTYNEHVGLRNQADDLRAQIETDLVTARRRLDELDALVATTSVLFESPVLSHEADLRGIAR